MKRMLFIGNGKDGIDLLHFFSAIETIEIVAIIDHTENVALHKLARRLAVPLDRDWRSWINQNIEIVMDMTDSEENLQELFQRKDKKTTVIPKSGTSLILEFFRGKEASFDEIKQFHHQEQIFNHIEDGLIAINVDENVEFVNKQAEEMIGIPQKNMLHMPIRELISKTQLPHVLRTRRKERNQTLVLDNGRKVITTSVPIIDKRGRLKGAFAFFRDMTEVLEMTEQVTGLKEVRKIIEATVSSFDRAVSIVDESGHIVLINPAYSQLTGLSEKQVMARPVNEFMQDEKNIHEKVLATRRPVKGVQSKIGPLQKEVVINAVPIITDGKLRGSVSVLHDISREETLTEELRQARHIIRSIERNWTFEDIVGSSSEMDLALEQAKAGARTEAAVLLRGEPGTGKELLAQAIHNEGTRKNNKYIKVSCAGVKESLLEREIFGNRQNNGFSFPGDKNAGCLERANHGTIFLDEIGELSLSLQEKLLRVLQDNELPSIDGGNPIALDVRIIAATARNLEKAVKNGDFLEDLYFLLNRLPVTVPPLRNRLDDLEELTSFLIKQMNVDYGRNVAYMETEAIDYLSRYQWPGNIRELKNVIGRAMIAMTTSETVICLQHLPELAVSKPLSGDLFDFPVVKGQSLQEMMDDYEKQVIESAYRMCDFNKTKTAELLGISLRNLYYKMDKYSISKNNVQNLS